MYFTPSFIQPWAVFFLWYLGCSDSLTYTQLIDIRLKKPAECSFPLLIQHDRCQSSEKRLCFRKCLNYTALLLHASKFFFNKKNCLRSKGAWFGGFNGGKHCLWSETRMVWWSYGGKHGNSSNFPDPLGGRRLEDIVQS